MLPNSYRLEGVVCWLESYVLMFAIKLFYCCKLIVYQSDHCLPIFCRVLLFNHNDITIMNVFFNHAVALYGKREQIARARHSIGRNGDSLSIFYRLNWLASGNVSEERNPNHAPYVAGFYAARFTSFFCYITTFLEF